MRLQDLPEKAANKQEIGGTFYNSSFLFDNVGIGH
jgi:hypothetical protein